MTEMIEMSWSDYCQLQRMNGSTLVAGRHSMRRLKRFIDSGFGEPTDAMRLGTGVHCLTLEPDEFEDRFVVMPDYHLDAANMRAAKRKDEPEADRRTESKATTYYKDKSDEFRKQNAGKEILTRQQYDDCLYAVECIHSRPKMRELICGAQKELTVLGEIDGVEFKGRIDIYKPGIIVDLKTTTTVEAVKFGYQFRDLEYAFKMAIYRELVRQATGDICEVKLIVQEKGGDFDNALVPIPDEVLDEGFQSVRNVLTLYKHCLETGYWPGVDGGADEYELVLPYRKEEFDFSLLNQSAEPLLVEEPF